MADEDSKADRESAGDESSMAAPSSEGSASHPRSPGVVGNDHVKNTPDEPPKVWPEDRAMLLQQARDFLATPVIHASDVSKKRGFLESKGLTHEEVDSLIDEPTAGLHSTPPPVPPKTYIPPSPPSKLPGMLVSLTRALGYGGALAGVGVMLYQRYIFPLLNDSFESRHSLRIHGLQLVEQLNKELTSLAKQTTMQPASNQLDNPEQTVNESLSDPSPHSVERHISPRVEPERLCASVVRLAEAATQDPNSTAAISRSTSFSRTLESVTDLIAYISSQTYLIPAASSFRLGTMGSSGGSVNVLGPAEEEVRRELKALKGLVLNRRSFAHGV
ncbi:uncharacterized protein EI90DRAFT_3116141 [Cantharellus anzutake]|uniref:uncharacterized protein n=1 Tax=Cantharellus anzutake TaxID=1750568 RepID=UPI0019031F00|nr:uncharacterized protein EI90DRAFT_3116141 [Cantharellus anzutake]KAF8342205.1 hypothetical protein EI90DRAFT_3116141 [Cantharellus anzutake]